ncbi:transposase [Treponema endosymbiont of Eucomonympha sp.]|uniref:transposase n=1 Tax=Treponema endosymbiont of Eucomonympha sp. TaxID=1580831 RepID=UPI001EE72212|nr:transposase [Treponema endosymbiont of Eucomonympha sp.]
MWQCGTVVDCSQAPLLMDGLETEAFLADKAYDANELLGMLKEADMVAVPPVKSRKGQRAYSHELYRTRHVIENVFRALKRRRGIATRCAKLTASFVRRHSCQVARCTVQRIHLAVSNIALRSMNTP